MRDQTTSRAEDEKRAELESSEIEHRNEIALLEANLRGANDQNVVEGLNGRISSLGQIVFSPSASRSDSPVGEIHWDHLKAQCSGCLRLSVIVRQEARESQPFHRSEVKTIKRGTVEFACAPLLAPRNMEELPRQIGAFEGVDFRKGAQSAPRSAQLCP